MRPRLHRPHVPPLRPGGAQPEPGPVFQFGGGGPLPAGFRRSGSRPGGAGGVMGFYDGQGNTDRASSWRLAQATRTPVLLAVRPQGTALTLAALVKGVQIFRSPSQIAGVLLNGCTQRLAELLTPAIQGGDRPAGCWGTCPSCPAAPSQPPPGAVYPRTRWRTCPPRWIGWPVSWRRPPTWTKSSRWPAPPRSWRRSPCRPSRTRRTAPWWPWPGTRPSAFTTRTTWTSCAGQGSGWPSSGPPGTSHSRRGPAASIWGAATRSSTPGP